MKKYEYFTLREDKNVMTGPISDDILNELGEQGWKCFSVLYDPEGVKTLCFRRQKQASSGIHHPQFLAEDVTLSAPEKPESLQ
jgi:hypothetical protein